MTNRTASNRTSEFQIAYAVILYLQSKRSGRRAATWGELRANLRHYIQQPFTDADREKRGNGAIKWHTVLSNIAAHASHPDNPCRLGILRVIPEGGLELLDDDLTKDKYKSFMRLAQWQGPQDITEDDRRQIVHWLVQYLTENVKPLVSQVRTAAEDELPQYDWPLIEDVAKKNVRVRVFNAKKQRWELVQKELTRLNKADSGFKIKTTHTTAPSAVEEPIARTLISKEPPGSLGYHMDHAEYHLSHAAYHSGQAKVILKKGK